MLKGMYTYFFTAILEFKRGLADRIFCNIFMSVIKLSAPGNRYYK